jgi:hypothetical protein
VAAVSVSRRGNLPKKVYFCRSCTVFSLLFFDASAVTDGAGTLYVPVFGHSARNMLLFLSI